MKPERPPIMKKPRAPLPPTFENLAAKDPVEVYSRIKPFPESSAVCVQPYDFKTIKLTPPTFRYGTGKEQYYKFQKVFQTDTSQKEIFNTVAKPLVSSLLAGKNGLLFAYGITGSGKTYTIQGNPQDGGIIRRAVDVIFNSISDCQARKYIFKPDRLNGFDVQTEADALLDRQRLENGPSYYGKTPRRFGRRRENTSSHSDDAIPDISKVSSIEDDNVYSIFVTYIEMYNNYTYDLLEEFAQNNMIRDLQSKILREDPKHNMYVHGVTEVEVKTPQDAIEVFLKGQNRRKVAQTKLNWESSRSHSVFTIRAVQAPLDEHGEEVVTNKNAITISQLSIVDLAGSERTNRTGASGERLKESGSINNSLMCLRQCIEILRENQMNGTNKKVPYRESKITHFFKNYFEGEGSVKMVVCVNPLAEYYDETLGVMKFAESAQEIQICRPTPARKDLGFTPGRRRANLILKEKRMLEEAKMQIPKPTETLVDLDIQYSLPPLPEMTFTPEEAESAINNIKEVLKKRIAIRENIRHKFNENVLSVKRKYEAMEKDAIHLRCENESLRANWESAHKKLRAFENHLNHVQSTNDSLTRKFSDYNTLLDDYKQACDERDMAKSQGLIEKQRMKTRLKAKIEVEKEKIRREMTSKLEQQKEQLKGCSGDILITFGGGGTQVVVQDGVPSVKRI